MKKFFLLMLSVFAFCAADAQVTTSGMNGTVTDADGQPLAGATVIAVHTPSGTQYGAVSDKNGGYNLQGLRTGGPYTVTFSFVGCQSVEFPGLMLSLGQTLKRDAFLKDSQQLEAVVITADGKNSSMNVNRAGAVTSISNEQIELMPTVNRSMNDIMRLTPQASSTTSGLAIGGGNYRQSYVTVDGAAFNNMFGIGGNLPAGGSPISLDALEPGVGVDNPLRRAPERIHGRSDQRRHQVGNQRPEGLGLPLLQERPAPGRQVRRRQTVAERDAEQHARIQRRRPDRQEQALRVRQLRARVEHHAGQLPGWPARAKARISAKPCNTTARRPRNSTR